mmetsp:Transcript_19921/g.35522  ORF Transcript_19921/g.35522 Transcript_19921/m.35522 type:complete len:80 (-) Transcript_19921:208-447(-)
MFCKVQYPCPIVTAPGVQSPQPHSTQYLENARNKTPIHLLSLKYPRYTVSVQSDGRQGPLNSPSGASDRLECQHRRGRQ